MGSQTLRDKRSRRRAALMTGSASNRVLMPSDSAQRRRGYYPHSGLVQLYVVMQWVQMAAVSL